MIGQFVDNISPKLIVKGCKFACDASRALNRNFAKVDLKNQIFNNVYKLAMKLFSSLAVPVAGVALIILVAVTLDIIVKNRRHSFSDDQVENENLNTDANSI